MRRSGPAGMVVDNKRQRSKEKKQAESESEEEGKTSEKAAEMFKKPDARINV